MITRFPLPFRPLADMRVAYAALVAIEAQYLKDNRRKHTIELTLSSTSKPVYDERGRPKLSNEVIEVRAAYESNDPAQVLEAHWFERAAQAAANPS